MRSWRKIVGEKPKVPYDSGKGPVTGTNPVPPQPSTSGPTSPETLSPDAVEKLLHKIMKEGGNASIAYLLAQAVSSDNIRDWSYRDILHLPKEGQLKWRHACNDEIEAIKRRGVYEEVNLPIGHKALENRWVFNRLVVKGFLQIEGIDFDEIFSLVVCYEVVRLILVLSALEGWHITGLDVKNAFLYGELDEEIYMKRPEGYRIKGQEHCVWHLLTTDAGVFVCQLDDGTIFLAIIYIDDALFIGPNQDFLHKKKAEFMTKWECRNLGEGNQDFLKMRIRRELNKFSIDQTSYLDKVLKRFGMENAKSAPTPLPTGYKPVNPDPVDPERHQKYQQVIRSLLYLMICTRPDIAYAVTKMAKFAINPLQEHLNKALYICRYLVGTRNYALTYDGTNGSGLEACTDSNWASDRDDCNSISSYFFKLADGGVSWTSHTKKLVALSSTEAEYMALSDCSRQAMAFRNTPTEMGYKDIGAIPMAGDNQGSIFIASNAVSDRHTKHIDIRYHYIRRRVKDSSSCYLMA